MQVLKGCCCKSQQELLCGSEAGPLICRCPQRGDEKQNLEKTGSHSFCDQLAGIKITINSEMCPIQNISFFAILVLREVVCSIIILWINTEVMHLFCMQEET
ncbi:hypothetical protein ILYODFUR_024363 [Ilyodon furcidens]|uniref:Uncharacterized protein n=1 Tax=Ilyodon furcidens TaxID=33524 RepID=A0ABV0ULL8_9TELE